MGSAVTWSEKAKLRSTKRISYFSTYSKEYRLNLRTKMLAKLGNQCVRCGFTDPRALQIDHVNGGGVNEVGKITKKKYYEMIVNDSVGKYQLLCANCNWIKRAENNETAFSLRKVVNIQDDKTSQ